VRSQTSAKEYFDLGCEKSKQQDFAGAISEFDKSIAINPHFGDAFANRGLARFHMKDYRGALKDFEEADRLIPNNQQLKALIELSRRLAGQ
jgi:tetratricopeptide (TPR) repeat protein